MNPDDARRLSFDELRDFEPVEWPGRQLLEKDNIGDWGRWLWRFEDVLEYALQDCSLDLAELASEMADEYFDECDAAGFSFPADFDDSGDREAAHAADRAAIVKEFTDYLRHWRDAVSNGRRRI